MRTCIAAPGSLLDATMSTPATRPCSAFIGSVVGMSLSFRGLDGADGARDRRADPASP